MLTSAQIEQLRAMLLDEVIYHAARHERQGTSPHASEREASAAIIWERLRRTLAALPADDPLWLRYAACWTAMSEQSGQMLGWTQRTLLGSYGLSIAGDGEARQFLALLLHRLGLVELTSGGRGAGRPQ